jgi:TonB family protein
MRKIIAALCVVLGAAGPEMQTLRAAESRQPATAKADAKIIPCGYPLTARGDETGTAVVHVSIDETGTPTKATISTSSGFPTLDAAALECAKKASWPPAQQQGKPIPSETDAKFEWTGKSLPQTCDRPTLRNSLLTITVHLFPEDVAHVTFEHPKPEAKLPAGVIGQSVICACVDEAGKIRNQVRLMQESGSSLLDSQAQEIGKTLVYPTGHAGCMRNAVNFKGPGD